MTDTASSWRPILVFLTGPPAVGKLTVGRALTRLTGMKLLHHHQILDLVTEYFAFGTPASARVVLSYRVQLMQEAAQSGLDLITTGACDFDNPADVEFVLRLLQPYVERQARICVVELLAPLSVLLQRNQTEHRRRRPKMEWSTDEYLRAFIPAHRWDSGDTFPFDCPHLRLETEHLSPEATAHCIAEHFGLPHG